MTIPIDANRYSSLRGNVYLRAVNILLTFDYELFFGPNSGTVEKCLLEPTWDLIDLAEGKAIRYTFFVDVGFLIHAAKYPELNVEMQLVHEQLKSILAKGHSLQLHVHPHWEHAEYLNGKWTMHAEKYYSLMNFDAISRAEIIHKYKSWLEDFSGKKVEAFRAGGWCIQPFSELRDIFEKEGLFIDSSVIPGDFLSTDQYHVDFRKAPFLSRYNFNSDVCQEDPQGKFTEFPIASMRYSPLFFWSLYLRGRLNPRRHKMIGDGSFLSQGGRKRDSLLYHSYKHVSSDGYFAGKLESALNMALNRGFSELVVIGHPKGNTVYSLEKLKVFIDRHYTKHPFISFEELL